MFIRRVIPVSILIGLALALTGLMGVVSAGGEADLGGSVKFRDNAQHSDSLVVELNSVDQPAAGTVYQGWLIAGDGSTISTGVLTVTDDAYTSGKISHAYTDPDGKNLLETYNTFAITVEQNPDDDTDTPGPFVYSGSVSSPVFRHVGHLLVSWPQNPDSVGVLVGLRAQVKGALAHAALAQASSGLTDKQSQLHHVLNIIEGPSGANYDASYATDGDSVGILSYAEDVITHANLAKTDGSGTTTVTMNADAVVAAANELVSQVTLARDQAVTALAETADGLVLSVLTSNVTHKLTIAESDAGTAYEAAQDIAQFTLSKGDPAPEPTPTPEAPATGDVSLGGPALAVLLSGMILAFGGVMLMVRRRVS